MEEEIVKKWLEEQESSKDTLDVGSKLLFNIKNKILEKEKDNDVLFKYASHYIMHSISIFKTAYSLDIWDPKDWKKIYLILIQHCIEGHGKFDLDT